MAGDSIAFALFTAGGLPKTDATPTFTAYRNRSGTARTPPEISHAGGGVYVFQPSTSDVAEGIAYAIDSGAGAYPERLSGAICTEAAPFAAVLLTDSAGALWTGAAPTVGFYDYVAPGSPNPNENAAVTDVVAGDGSELPQSFTVVNQLPGTPAVNLKAVNEQAGLGDIGWHIEGVDHNGQAAAEDVTGFGGDPPHTTEKYWRSITSAYAVVGSPALPALMYLLQGAEGRSASPAAPSLVPVAGAYLYTLTPTAVDLLAGVAYRIDAPSGASPSYSSGAFALASSSEPASAGALAPVGMFQQTVSYAAVSSRDAWGKPTMGPISTSRARVQSTRVFVRDAAGDSLQANYVVYLPPAVPVTLQHRIWLTSEGDSTGVALASRRILAIDKMRDGSAASRFQKVYV